MGLQPGARFRAPCARCMLGRGYGPAFACALGAASKAVAQARGLSKGRLGTAAMIFARRAWQPEISQAYLALVSIHQSQYSCSAPRSARRCAACPANTLLRQQASGRAAWRPRVCTGGGTQVRPEPWCRPTAGRQLRQLRQLRPTGHNSLSKHWRPKTQRFGSGAGGGRERESLAGRRRAGCRLGRPCDAGRMGLAAKAPAARLPAALAAGAPRCASDHLPNHAES
jgi:hypothetical protein